MTSLIPAPALVVKKELRFTPYSLKNAVAPDAWRVRSGDGGGLKLTFSAPVTRDSPDTKLSFSGTWAKMQGIEIQITKWTDDAKNSLIYVTDGDKMYRLRFVGGHATQTDTYQTLRQKLRGCNKITEESITK
jgi:hypothetical protein